MLVARWPPEHFGAGAGTGKTVVLIHRAPRRVPPAAEATRFADSVVRSPRSIRGGFLIGHCDERIRPLTLFGIRATNLGFGLVAPAPAAAVPNEHQRVWPGVMPATTVPFPVTVRRFPRWGSHPGRCRRRVVTSPPVLDRLSIGWRSGSAATARPRSAVGGGSFGAFERGRHAHQGGHRDRYPSRTVRSSGRRVTGRPERGRVDGVAAATTRPLR